ncbi:uncharacterized protein KGF55_005621 [Candida pseudojiufengensis]|uniref:uncharacterized protein n=1 Tax=Candida pseudojiufengensis TaxID=497109 RepID=UPI002224FB60|nr:uncharacterized protein KGF55_005621 [Candida pseudojiufengensis]KAI5958967.1 hypothetical protein KGF55_005621 [Candida pseudojiufengensis]
MIKSYISKVFKKLKTYSSYWIIGILLLFIPLQLYFGSSSYLFSSPSSSIYLISNLRNLFNLQTSPIIFPNNYFKNDHQFATFIDNYKKDIKLHGEKAKYIYAKNINPMNNQKQMEYKPLEYSMFNNVKNIDLDLTRCEEIETNNQFEISESKAIENELTLILKNILKEIEDPNGDQYLKDLKQMILPELKLQLNLNIIEKFWYKVAISSIWLKNYGIYYSISRIMYSPTGIRNRPLFSLTYAQIFDENWNELKDYKLFIPVESIEDALKEVESDIYEDDDVNIKLEKREMEKEIVETEKEGETTPQSKEEVESEKHGEKPPAKDEVEVDKINENDLEKPESINPDTKVEPENLESENRDPKAPDSENHANLVDTNVQVNAEKQPLKQSNKPSDKPPSKPISKPGNLVDMNVQVSADKSSKQSNTQTNANAKSNKNPKTLKYKLKKLKTFQHKIIKFPHFVSIPFFKDLNNPDANYYGPEDPRLILVKNKLGYEEPIIIFNSYHLKPDLYDDDDDTRINQKFDYYRSMFLAWPWQIKPNSHKNEINIIELNLQDFKSLKVQKNWTPFISYHDRFSKDGVEGNGLGYDTHLYFIFRWANLEVLKCDFKFGNCKFDYRLDNKLSTYNQVGPLRGGTQLININEILDLPIEYPKEIWIGVARAHLDNCGCGETMYRPNLVIISRDLNSKKEEGNNEFQLTHVSSALTFNMFVFGWDIMIPEDSCGKLNILIPNGISVWSFETKEDLPKLEEISKKEILKEEEEISNKEVSKEETPTSNEIETRVHRILNNIKDDYLTITLTISDYENYRINIKGLLKNLKDLNIFEITDQKQNHNNNNNVVCAMESSTNYCENYGRNNKFKSSNKKLKLDFENMILDPLKLKYFKLTNKYGLRGVENYKKEEEEG